MPRRWFYEPGPTAPDDSYVGYSEEDFNQTTRIIAFDGYSEDFAGPVFTGDLSNGDRYRSQIAYWNDTYGIPYTYKDGDQLNPASLWPCMCNSGCARDSHVEPHTECLTTRLLSADEPILISPRYGASDLLSELDPQGTIFGIDSLPSSHSKTAVLGRHAVAALQRLGPGARPWVLTVSFENPRKCGAGVRAGLRVSC